MSKKLAAGEVELSNREKEYILQNAIIIETRRPDGSLRIQQDFSHCPTMAEQHTAHLTDINYLVEKYKPDELAAYIAARNAHRREILGHDFSQELNLQEAQNVVYRSRQAFEDLPEEIKKNFRNHVEFIKFIDNPANVEKMIDMGLMTRKQIEDIKIEKEPVKNSEEDAKSIAKDDTISQKKAQKT